MQTHANLKQTEADKRHHREVMRGRSWRYDNKTSAVCSLLPSTSQHEHYHLTGLSSHCPHTQPKLAIAVLLLLLLLAPAFNFTRVGRVMASAFCGLPTHMVRVAIRSCAPPPLHRSLWDMRGDMGREGDRHSPRGRHSYWEACMGLVMTAMRTGLRRATAAISVMPRSLESTK